MKKYNRVYIEITNICNLNCNFCPKTSRIKKYMSVEEFTHILNEVKPYADNVFFHIMGEPLLNHNLKSFLDIAYKKGFKVTITTNGTLINKSKHILLSAKCLKKINVSLHSFEANESKVDFEKYILDTLDFAVETSNNTNIVIALRLWNLHSKKLIGENALNFDILKLISQKFDYQNDLHKELEINNSVRVKRNVYINTAEKFKWPDINSKDQVETGFCHALRNQFGILSDGTVVPCCLDSEGNIPLGNIFNMPLNEILNCERAKNMYNSFSKRMRVEKLCKTCGYSERF